MKKDKEINELSAKIAELLACMPSATSGGGSGGSSSRGPNVPVTSLASYVGNERYLFTIFLFTSLFSVKFFDHEIFT